MYQRVGGGWRVVGWVEVRVWMGAAEEGRRAVVEGRPVEQEGNGSQAAQSNISTKAASLAKEAAF